MKPLATAAILLLASLAARAQVSLTDNEGKVVKGRDFTVTEQGEAVLTSDSGAATRRKLEEIAEVVFEARNLARAEWAVELNNANARNRDILAGKLGDPPADDDSVLVLRGTDAGDLNVPLNFAYSLRALSVASNFEFEENPSPDRPDTVFIRRAGKPADFDRGTVMKVAAGQVDLESDTFKSTRSYKLADIEGILFASLKVAENPGGLQVTVSTRHGMRVTGTLLGMDDKVCRVRTAHKQKDKPWTIDIQAPEVTSIHVLGGNLVYLSDMTPRLLDTEHLGITGMDEKPTDEGPWFYLDRLAESNKPIEMGGKRYRKGIATRKRVEIEFDLNGEYSKFAAVVGLTSDAQPTTRAYAKLTFVVRADGREAWRSKVATWDSGVEPVSLEVKGVKKLVLATEYADELDSLAYGGWGDARVVK